MRRGPVHDEDRHAFGAVPGNHSANFLLHPNLVQPSRKETYFHSLNLSPAACCLPSSWQPSVAGSPCPDHHLPATTSARNHRNPEIGGSDGRHAVPLVSVRLPAREPRRAR